MSTRLPLQLGRASLNQGARFAACVVLGPELLILAAMFMPATVLGAMVLGLAGVIGIVFAVDAAGTARRDRPCDIVIDATGFTIEGGPLDKTHLRWSEVDADGCAIVEDETRIAVRWWILNVLTARRIAWISERVDVSVHRLELDREGQGKLVLAEAEGDELASLQQLRGSIRAAGAPHDDAHRDLPQEILKCPHCGAPQVPAATPTMTCSACRHELDVPAELQQRMRASAELEQTSGSRARMVRKLVQQPGARRAGAVVAWCRRVMVWIQPAAIIFLVVLMHHQTSAREFPDGMGAVREAPSDDGVFFYDIGLLVLVIVGTFGIAWSIGHAYIANRQALRMLADNFGAVPPVKPGAPSTCRQCSAPLPASTALLVHCVYCSAENVLGIDPRPAALRSKRSQIELSRGLRRRMRARLRLAIVLPLSVALGLAMIREVRIAWHVPEHSVEGWDPACVGRCGTVANGDAIRRSFTIIKAGQRVPLTVLPHGKVSWSCFSECTVDVGGMHVTPAFDTQTDLRIDHGEAHPVTR